MELVTGKLAWPNAGDEAEGAPADEGEGDRHADREGDPAARRHPQGAAAARGARVAGMVVMAVSPFHPVPR